MPSSSPAAMAAADRAAAALDRLARLHPKLIDLGLDRSFALLEKLGNPHHHLPPTIHVAGTNGKGSTIAFLRAMTEGAGLKVHVYSSPHLCRFNERIRLAGRLIDDGGLADLLEEVETANGDMAVTFFEVTTAAAMLAFSRVPADLLLLETGLGGALDSTNVLKTPLATIITPIARDHENFLGTDLGQIASQKAGIMRAQTPCYSADQQTVIMHVLAAHAKNIGASLQVAGRDFYQAETDDGGIRTCPVRAKISFSQHRGFAARISMIMLHWRRHVFLIWRQKTDCHHRARPNGKCVFQRHSIGCLARAGAATK